MRQRPTAAGCGGRSNRRWTPKIQIRRLIELELRTAVSRATASMSISSLSSPSERAGSSDSKRSRAGIALCSAAYLRPMILIVEEIGLMEEMGAAVLRRACAACAAWPDGVSVSVNLSSTQFRNGNLEKTILGALAAANLPPERLDLEITELTLLDDRGDTRHALQALRARGLRISLDDFGTGYSSLSYLLSFPLDRIKIDRTFTMGLGERHRLRMSPQGC